MALNFVVLTDFSPAGARAQAYAAALAAPVGAVLHLVHIASPMPVTTLEYGLSLPALDGGYVREIRHSLAQDAARLPVPATAEVVENDWYAAVVQALAAYRPALLISGLTATHGRFDEWFSNRTLPLAHNTGYPLLLVPEHLPAAAVHPPRRLALAVRDQPFALAPPAAALAPLLAALGTAVLPITVLPAAEAGAGQRGWRAVQHCGLAAALPPGGLHRVVGPAPAAGIQQAVAELSADVLALLDSGHGWMNMLFGGSVLSEVLRHTQVPVLLLATQELPSE
ncbi:universal stress protein [Hymenobacter nivis]|uniref:UspA domain-containing protein n=1 Tax=Hymenobacter nivis TaxID=1850093 RepID=A0A2Z3GKG3_9BACT|nr:universal stress protein [Hymenobacter nivis]AWM31626.1 hypothetical protein DDQ68_01765 [Hymenobacter nivis]